MGAPLKDETGNTYGYLTVIERAPNNKEGRAMWKCKCICGNEVIVLGKHLRSGNTKSCGCYQKQRAIESNLKRGGDLTGKKFGKLTVLEEDGFVVDSNGKRRRKWKCLCDCGNVCSIMGVYLSSGETKSCGCINSLGNIKISKILTAKNIPFKAEYSFPDLLSDKGKRLRFDFGILDDNKNLLCLIEYQGEIHYTARSHGWNNPEALIERQKRDDIKYFYCRDKGIKLKYITYLENIEERLEEILNEL